jgi:apolipoprotein D and lipocalin family protein
MGVRPLVCAIVVFAALPQGSGPQTAPHTVATVDLQQYAGTYYEIARFPNDFQKQCVADVTATYTVRPDGRLDVFNRCRKADGTIADAHGVARRAGGDTSNARLEVRFAPAWRSLLPGVWGAYWILAIGPEYSYAVIGDPQRNCLWILSRLPQMPDVAYRQAIEVAKSNEYDVERLVKTPHER